MKKKLPKYLINEAKFLLALDRGETFKTAYRTITSHRSKGQVHYKQEFSYSFDMEFIKNNEKKLKELEILSEEIED